jgi:predicted Zn-dependent protease
MLLLSGRRWLLALLVALCSLITYCTSSSYNPITGETQYVGLTEEQEVALGLQAAPQLIDEYGGLHPDQELQQLIDQIGQRLVEQTVAAETPYQFEFYLLGNEEIINAFALPGGPIFMTKGLLDQLQTEGEIAGVLAHEIAHVLARHAAEQIAKGRLAEELSGVAVIAAYDPEDPQASQQTAVISQIVGQLLTLRYGREDELESDRLGVRFMGEGGYDPHALIRVMRALSESAGGVEIPEFFSTHPNPDQRLERIQAAIQEEFPEGVPEGLTQ